MAEGNEARKKHKKQRREDFTPVADESHGGDEEAFTTPKHKKHGKVKREPREEEPVTAADERGDSTKKKKKKQKIAEPESPEAPAHKASAETKGATTPGKTKGVEVPKSASKPKHKAALADYVARLAEVLDGAQGGDAPAAVGFPGPSQVSRVFRAKKGAEEPAAGGSALDPATAKAAFFNSCGRLGARAVTMMQSLLKVESETLHLSLGAAPSTHAGPAKVAPLELGALLPPAHPDIPLPKQYAQLAMWRGISQLNGVVARSLPVWLAAAQTEAAAVEERGQGGAAELAQDSARAPADHGHGAGGGGDARRGAADPATFRQWYSSLFADAFADDLYSMQQAEGKNWDSAHTEMLLGCIEAGADIFSGLERELVLQSFAQS
eukprot:jgi/Mesvir1/17182/Mv07603-RA.1